MAAPNDALDVMRLLSHLHLLAGRPEHAVTLLRAVCSLLPEDRRAQKSLARACLRAGNPAYALQVVEKLQDGGDMSAVLHLLRGQALAAVGRAADARDSFDRFAQARIAEQIITDPAEFS
jgi:Flp pilus assembly protein TadD